MTHEQRKYVIALTFLYKEKLHFLRELLSTYPDPIEALHRAQLAGKQEALAAADKEQGFIEKHGIRTFFLHDDDYPPLLKQCSDAPVLLYSKGNVSFTGRLVSVVGTRQATERGKLLTHECVAALAERVPDLTIVSGLAYGIDIAAHRAALELGIPTIIIPAHGLDRIYPAIHRKEAVRALELGGILTEYPSGTTPERLNFLARNRIIAGLSDCTIVVESHEHGGALVTAALANDYNRTVCTFPGRTTDLASVGCNNLIKRNKAVLITSADDIMREMNWATPNRPIQTELFANNSPANDTDTDLQPQERQIIQMLRANESGMHINTLAEKMQTGYTEMVTCLMMLEMKRKVKSLPGGIYISL